VDDVITHVHDTEMANNDDFFTALKGNTQYTGVTLVLHWCYTVGKMRLYCSYTAVTHDTEMANNDDFFTAF
jgi:hypothetical protein